MAEEELRQKEEEMLQRVLKESLLEFNRRASEEMGEEVKAEGTGRRRRGGRNRECAQAEEKKKWVPKVRQ